MNMVFYFKFDFLNEMNFENVFFFLLVWYNSYNLFFVNESNWLIVYRD